MQWMNLARKLLEMNDAEQRAFLRKLNELQLQALQRAALQLRQSGELEGLGELGFKFGNLLKNIGGALIPFTSLIPGIGPIVAAVGTAAFQSFASSGGGQAVAPQAPPPPPPPPPQAQATPSGGFTISPIMLMAGVALIVLMKK